MQFLKLIPIHVYAIVFMIMMVLGICGYLLYQKQQQRIEVEKQLNQLQEQKAQEDTQRIDEQKNAVREAGNATNEARNANYNGLSDDELRRKLIEKARGLR